MGKYTDRLNDRIKLTHYREYYREPTATYLTAIEWRNVELSEEFAEYLKDDKSLLHFPYFRQIKTLWGILFQSLRANAKKQSIWQILTSEDFFMDVFISVFTTLEMLPKGIISLVLFPFFSKQNPTEMQQHIATYYKDYCKKLQLIPFYEHDYKTTREALAKQYNECKQHTFGDWISWTITSLELRARRIISMPLAHWFSQEGNIVPRTTDVLVKFKSSADSAAAAKKEFMDAFSKVQAQVSSNFNQEDTNVHPQVVETDIYVKAPNALKNKTEYTVYARIKVPRYKEFIPVVQWLNENQIQIRRIAGHDNVQVKCLSENSDLTLNGQKPMYSYGDDIHPNRRFFLFDTPVRDLTKTMDAATTETAKIEFIHNY